MTYEMTLSPDRIMTFEDITREMFWIGRRTTTASNYEADYHEYMRLMRADAAIVSWQASVSQGITTDVSIDFFRSRLPEYVI